MKSPINSGFAMVEMLAVVSVMSIIVALTIPNGIFARSTASEAEIRAKASAIETAIGTFKFRGGYKAAEEWAGRYTQNPAAINMLPLLQDYLGVASVSSYLTSFEGYTVIFPATLNAPLVVRRTADDAVVYP